MLLSRFLTFFAFFLGFFFFDSWRQPSVGSIVLVGGQQIYVVPDTDMDIQFVLTSGNEQLRVSSGEQNVVGG